MNNLTNGATTVASGASTSGMSVQAAMPDAAGDERRAKLEASLKHSIATYRYSKAKPNVVSCPSDDGFKSLAAVLAERAGGTWTGRAHGYLMSARQVQKFNQSMSDALAMQIA